MSERIDNFALNPFLDGPAEFIATSIKNHLLSIPQFVTIFGESIDDYRRMDYSIRQLPALRVYNEEYEKQFDSWFITGWILLDVIFPANIRRSNTQRLQDTIASAILQMFRSTTFFNLVRADVPGLNELGKTFGSDKRLGFEWNTEVVPLTQLRINFRVDLREWDLYLEQSGRTKDDPFNVTLGELKKIATTIKALRDDDTVELEINSQMHTPTV